MITDVPATNRLAPEDYQLIEEEHLRLHGLLNIVHDTCCNLENELGCQNCDSGKIASCQGQLTSLSYNLAYLTENHFHDEESIMRHSQYATAEFEQFLRHHQAHVNILDELREIASECASLAKSGDVSEGYRQLYKRMAALLEEHGRLHDDPFLRSTKS